MGKYYVYGKVISGKVAKGMTLTLIPSKRSIKIDKILNDEDKEYAVIGENENCKLYFQNIDFGDIKKGYVIASSNPTIYCCYEIEAEFEVFYLDEESIFSTGFEAILHIHTAEEIVTVTKITKNYSNNNLNKKYLRKGDIGLIRLKSNNILCVEKYEFINKLGCFILRKNTSTIGKGIIKRLKPVTQTTNNTIDISNYDDIALNNNNIEDNNNIFNDGIGEDI